MTTIQMSNPVEKVFLQLEGSNTESKLVQLILRDVENRLRACLERLYMFEKKHGMTFGEFDDAWKRGQIDKKYSHETEADYMEWESINDEHGVLLHQLRQARESLSA